MVPLKGDKGAEANAEAAAVDDGVANGSQGDKIE